jgi:magnesium chelatase family protein
MLFVDEFPEFAPQALDSLRQPVGDGRGRNCARQSPHHLSGAVQAHRCDEPMPLGTRERSLPAGARRRLPGPALRSPARPHRFAHRSACCDRGRSHPAAAGGRQPRSGSARRPRPRLNNVRTNAQASGPVLEEVARADVSGLALLREAALSMQLSARGYHRVAAGCPHLGRPRWSRKSRPRALRRSPFLSRHERRNPPRGLNSRPLR